MGPPKKKKSRYYTIEMYNSGSAAFNIAVKKEKARVHVSNYRCRLNNSVAVRSTVYGDYPPDIVLKQYTETYDHERGRIRFNSYARRRRV